MGSCPSLSAAESNKPLEFKGLRVLGHAPELFLGIVFYLKLID